MARGKREGKVTQKQMVSAALSDKGWEAKPAELQAFIKDDITRVHDVASEQGWLVK